MTIDQITDQLEKRMVNPPKTSSCSRPYPAGYIDAMYDAGLLNTEERARLYFEYADPETARRLAKKLA